MLATRAKNATVEKTYQRVSKPEIERFIRANGMSEEDFTNLAASVLPESAPLREFWNGSTNPNGVKHERLNQCQPGGISYEQALGELERIVAALESEERPLEEALALYERGQVLARFCAGLLDNAELKVQHFLGKTWTTSSRE